jgi:hypothetical protein
MEIEKEQEEKIVLDMSTATDEDIARVLQSQENAKAPKILTEEEKKEQF